MKDEHPYSASCLEGYRNYLQLVARLQLDGRLMGKVDISGVVQQTMLDAHQALPMKHLEDSDHLTAWLRRILVNNLADEVRRLQTAKRNVKRELSLDIALQQSSQYLLSWLAAEQSTPSANLQRQEQALQLVRALSRLPEAQREAITMRYLQGLTLGDIAERLDRNRVAVAGLLKRGLHSLRDYWHD